MNAAGKSSDPPLTHRCVPDKDHGCPASSSFCQGTCTPPIGERSGLVELLGPTGASDWPIGHRVECILREPLGACKPSQAPFRLQSWFGTAQTAMPRLHTHESSHGGSHEEVGLSIDTNSSTDLDTVQDTQRNLRVSSTCLCVAAAILRKDSEREVRTIVNCTLEPVDEWFRKRLRHSSISRHPQQREERVVLHAHAHMEKRAC